MNAIEYINSLFNPKNFFLINHSKIFNRYLVITTSCLRERARYISVYDRAFSMIFNICIVYSLYFLYIEFHSKILNIHRDIGPSILRGIEQTVYSIFINYFIKLNAFFSIFGGWNFLNGYLAAPAAGQGFFGPLIVRSFASHKKNILHIIYFMWYIKYISSHYLFCHDVIHVCFSGWLYL